MTRLKYAVPPLDDDGEPARGSFVELPPVVEAALVMRSEQILPALILSPDMAVPLSWAQAEQLRGLLDDWLRLHRAWTKTGPPIEDAVVGSEAI